MLTMLLWKSQPQMHKESLAKFTSKGLEKIPGLEVVSAHHGIGIGFWLVKTDGLEPVLHLCAKWAHLVDIEAHAVLPAETALETLRHASA